jgi:ribosomal protein S18 acetylase RimI-like enzyme
MNTKIYDNPGDEEITFIKESLDAYNFRIVPHDNHQPLSFIARSDQNEIIGGIIGGTYWGWLVIDRFWIKEEFRRQGLGTTLLGKMEESAIQRGCNNAHLDTHDFQALEFYLKKGYTIKSELPDLPKGHTRYLLWKRLKDD